MATSWLDDALSYLLTDPNQPGGGWLARNFLGPASPTASTQTPIIPPSTTSPSLAGPTLGGTPPATATGGLLGGQLPASGYGAASRGLRSGLFGGGMLGNSPLVDMLGGALAGLANVQPGQTGLAAIGAGAQGATTAAQDRRDRELRNLYYGSRVQSAVTGAEEKQQKAAALETAIAGLPKDQQDLARGNPDAYFAQLARSKFTAAEPAKPPQTQTRHLPGGMDQDVTWNADTKQWEPSGPSYARWAPQQPSQGDRTLVPIYDPDPKNPTHQRLVPRPDAVGQPTGTPPTPRQPSISDVIQPIFEKVARGEPLTPGEQRAFDAYQHTSQIDQLLREQQQGGGGQGGSQSQGGTQPAQPAPPPVTPPTTLTSPAPPLGQGSAASGGAASSSGTQPSSGQGAGGGSANRGASQDNPIATDATNSVATMRSIIQNGAPVWLQLPDGTVAQMDPAGAQAWLAKHAPGS